ncbi:helix-turn-helix domain-containing protein [Aeoliella mucimassa]|uniref:SnoaL-like domain protein n=1 Tax=Aeoliella mucimassa TaxID=2527972 RepID=A0A518ARF6_9BACT|nr:helix-turn-helix domain-containing protein [Aeoliella mucimassa]QDU57296.1 SnoaL-like domain protein [Aeoliella mucimassa]
MDSKPNNQPRFRPCNGEAIRSLRQSRGWTQRELANRSGYSLRLIQKAESGGTLLPETIHVLAKSLSTDRALVSVQELTATPLSIVQQFIEAINKYFQATVSEVPHLISEELVLWCAGEPEQVPFAGTWHGHEGLDAFLTTFFSILTPQHDPFLNSIRYATSGDEVVAWGEAIAAVDGMPAPSVWVWHRYVVRDGKITHFDNHFDTQVGTMHLAEARARGLLEHDE